MSYAPSQKSSRQATGVVTVIGLHVLIIYALANGLGHQVIEVIRAPLETRVIDEIKKPPETPPAPPPKLAPPPPPFIPLPDFKVQTAAAPANAITAVTTTKPVEAPPPVVKAPEPVAEPVHVAPVKDTVHPCRNPEYPSISRRLGEAGSVALAILVDVDGKALDAKVETSSGFPRLDNAAREALQLCQFKPGTVDGKPEKAWARIRYNWTLE